MLHMPQTQHAKCQQQRESLMMEPSRERQLFKHLKKDFYYYIYKLSITLLANCEDFKTMLYPTRL